MEQTARALRAQREQSEKLQKENKLKGETDTQLSYTLCTTALYTPTLHITRTNNTTRSHMHNCTLNISISHQRLLRIRTVTAGEYEWCVCRMTRHLDDLRTLPKLNVCVCVCAELLKGKELVQQDLRAVQLDALEEECKRAGRIALNNYNHAQVHIVSHMPPAKDALMRL